MSSLEVSTLSNMTVASLKKMAKERNIKIPSNLTKQNIIQYILGYMNETPKKKVTRKNNPSIWPVKINPNVDWICHLHEYGWATVPIEGWKTLYVDNFFNKLEACCENFNRYDPNTWKPNNIFNMKHYFGHTEMQWQIRELCAPIFAKIWNCNKEDLLCSFEGGSFLTSSSNTKYKIQADQSRDLREFSCIKGIVNFCNNGSKDGGLVLVENSHNIFSDYMDKHPSQGIASTKIDLHDDLLKDSRLIKICANEGEIILYDSRSFYYFTNPIGNDRFNMCTYVSMQPNFGASRKDIELRKSLYLSGKMTNGWCYGSNMKEIPQKPRVYTDNHSIIPGIIEIAELNDFRRKLVGYK